MLKINISTIRICFYYVAMSLIFIKLALKLLREIDSINFYQILFSNKFSVGLHDLYMAFKKLYLILYQYFNQFQMYSLKRIKRMHKIIFFCIDTH